MGNRTINDRKYAILPRAVEADPVMKVHNNAGEPCAIVSTIYFRGVVDKAMSPSSTYVVVPHHHPTPILLSKPHLLLLCLINNIL